MARVINRVPSAHLLLAGKCNDSDYKKRVQEEIEALGLQGNVSILGERHDVAAILRACDIGVLSSTYEGLPMSLLEYGAASLPAVATTVGQCSDVLDRGLAGILVPSGSADDLAASLLSLLNSADERFRLGKCFRARVAEVYSADVVIGQVCQIYDTLDSRQGKHAQNTPIQCSIPSKT